MMEQLESQKVISIGGLNSNINHIQLSDYEPGSAVELINFEASLYGGYRRLSGFQPFDELNAEVDPAGAEGRILGIAFYEDTIIVARKQQSGDTYDFYSYSGSGWIKMPTTFSKNSNDVLRIRYKEFNFNGTPKICFVDGVNPAMIYDGTNWTQILTSNNGLTYATAGGDQAIEAPAYVDVFKNHLFLAQDHIVFHSAPLVEYDFLAASGAGQLPAGYLVNQIKPFRDTLYVFGTNNIKKIEVSSTAFVLNGVTSSIGCLASDSVQEINGDLIFLSQDGFRPIAGTNYIGDVNLESLSRKIQQLVTSEVASNSMNELCSVLIRAKSQVRFFFSSPSKEPSATFGIIGCLRPNADGSNTWEWSRSKGIRASCATSKYIGATEFVIHGDYDGRVYRQEVGNTFAGEYVQAVFSTPFLDFGAAGVRKTFRKLRLFLRPEGNVTINARMIYDWADTIKENNTNYDFYRESDDSMFGEDDYGIAIYSSPTAPVLISPVEGSGFSLQIKFTTFDAAAPYSIQGILIDYTVEGRK